MNQTKDAKGVPVRIDSLVEGFSGRNNKRATGRVVAISQWGWITAFEPDEEAAYGGGHQHIFYENRYLVRGDPRPLRERGDVPERLVHP